MDTASFANPLGKGIRSESFRGFTGSDGTLSFTFAQPFTQILAMNVERLPPTTAAITTRLTALSLTGASAIAEARSSLAVAGVNVLSFAVAPVVGQEVSIQVMGR